MFRVLASICFVHQLSKVDTGTAATLSHSKAYLYLGGVVGSLWLNVKMSARSRSSFASFSSFTHASGSAISVSSQASSCKVAILSHFPCTTIDAPFTCSAGTLTHFPLLLISIL